MRNVLPRVGIKRMVWAVVLGSALVGCTSTIPPPQFDFSAQRTTFLTHDTFDNLNPTWSPDGNTVVYVSNRNGGWNLWAVTLDGAAPRALTTGPGEDRFPAFSPDGKRLAFASRRSGNWDIWAVNPDGTGLAQLTTHRMDDLAPAWSWDGKQIAFDSYRDFEYSIYVMDADGANQRKLTTGGNGDWGASFAPSGDTVVFASTRTGHGDLYAIDLAGKGPYRRLTQTESEREMIPTFNADGSKIAFVAEREGGRDIWVMDPDGSRQTRLTRNLSGAWQPRFSVDRELYAAIGYFTVAWSPDGRSLAYTHVDRDGTGQIAILSLAR